MRFLDPELTSFNIEVSSSEDAVRLAGHLLQKNGIVEKRYVDAMVGAYREKGPYFVIAPHVALPHARPTDGVLEASVALLHLKTPVTFGHQINDPVKLVFALGASNSQEHIKLIKRLTRLLGAAQNIEKIKLAEQFEDIEFLIRGDEK